MAFVRKLAYHEAGHAVQAQLNGLGVFSVSIDPDARKGETRTLEHHRLEQVEGFKLNDPPAVPDDRLVKFYKRHIEVQAAGPLAQCRMTEETTGGALHSGYTFGERAYTLHGGGGDWHFANRESEILAGWGIPIDVKEVTARVWHATLFDAQRWALIQRVAAELEEKRTLDQTGFQVWITPPVTGA